MKDYTKEWIWSFNIRTENVDICDFGSQIKKKIIEFLRKHKNVKIVVSMNINFQKVEIGNVERYVYKDFEYYLKHKRKN